MAQHVKLKKLIKELTPFQRNCLSLCLEFLREYTTYDSNASLTFADKLACIFDPPFDLSDYNIQSMVLILEIMIKN